MYSTSGWSWGPRGAAWRECDVYVKHDRLWWRVACVDERERQTGNPCMASCRDDEFLQLLYGDFE